MVQKKLVMKVINNLVHKRRVQVSQKLYSHDILVDLLVSFRAIYREILYVWPLHFASNTSSMFPVLLYIYIMRQCRPAQWIMSSAPVFTGVVCSLTHGLQLGNRCVPEMQGVLDKNCCQGNLGATRDIVNKIKRRIGAIEKFHVPQFFCFFFQQCNNVKHHRLLLQFIGNNTVMDFVSIYLVLHLSRTKYVVFNIILPIDLFFYYKYVHKQRTNNCGCLYYRWSRLLQGEIKFSNNKEVVLESSGG